MTTTADRTAHPPMLGEGITSVEQALAIPVGTTLLGSGGATYEVREREGSNYLYNTGTQRWMGTSMGSIRTDGRVKVHQYPAGFTPPAPEGFTLPSEVGSSDFDTEIDLSRRETLARYKQRFRTTIFGRSLRAGTGLSYVENAMQVLDIPMPDPTPGMVLYGSDSQHMALMPNGTVMHGGVESIHNQWSVLGKEHGNWRPLAGSADSTFILFTVDSVPGVPEPAAWVTEPATPEDERLIWDFKQAAERVGARAQSSTGWCGEYDASMRSAGVDRRIHRANYIPPFTPEQVAEQGVGAVFRVDIGAYDYVYMIRDDASTNPARTRRLVGTVPGAWAQAMRAARSRPTASREIQGVPNVLPIWIGVEGPREMDRMPNGTFVVDSGLHAWEKREGRHGTLWYRLARNGGRSDDYGYTGRDFSHDDLWYAWIGAEA